MPLYMWITIIRLLLCFCKQLWEYMLLRKHEGITFIPANIPCLYWEELKKQNPSLNRQLHVFALTSFWLKCLKVIIIDFCWGVCFHPKTMSSCEGPCIWLLVSESGFTHCTLSDEPLETTFRSRFTPKSKERNISLGENAAYFLFLHWYHKN